MSNHEELLLYRILSTSRVNTAHCYPCCLLICLSAACFLPEKKVHDDQKHVCSKHDSRLRPTVLVLLQSVNNLLYC